MTIADKLKQIKQSTDAIKASATALTGEVQTDLTSIAIILDTANPANATDILNMLGYTSTNAPDLYNAFLNSLNKEEGASYTNDTSVLLPKLTVDANGVYTGKMYMFKGSTILTVPKGKYRVLNGLSPAYNEMFSGCTSLLWVPDLELLGTNMYNTYSCSKMFQSCSSLRTVGNLNMKGCTDAFNMFQGCANLESIKALDTSDVTNMESMFNFCLKLVDVPQLDTSKVTTMRMMFRDCQSLVNIPQLDTSKVTNMSYIFQNCNNLKSIPQWDFRAATDLNYGFSGCSLLTETPDLNLDSVTNVSSLFYGDSALVTIGALNTPKVTNITYMLQNCPSIEKITSLDVRAVTNNSYITGFSGTIKPLKYMLLKNLGQSTATSWGLSSFPNWGVNDDKYPDARQSLIDTLITYSYDRASAGMSTCTIKLDSKTKALLTEDEIAQITAKGFTIS